MSFQISESGDRKSVCKRLREAYTGCSEEAVQIANLLADRIERTVNDSAQPISVHVSGHVMVHPKHYG